MPGLELEKSKKKIWKIFQHCDFKITIKNNLHISNFIDVTSNLKNGKNYLFRKPKSHTLYVHLLSNKFKKYN